MNALQNGEELLSSLMPSEKARLLLQIVNEIDGIYPGVESDPATNGGDPSIVWTPIPICLLVQACQSGANETGLLDN